MEEWQKEHILENLCDLLENTMCNILLLAKLMSLKALTSSEKDKILAKPENVERSSLLYDILQTRTNGYAALTKALHEGRQSGAAKILLTGYLKHGTAHDLETCGIAHNYDVVFSSEFMFQGRVVKLKDIFEQFDENDLKAIMKNFACQKDFIEFFIIGGKKLVLVAQTIPPLPPLYIPRAISNRIKINPSTFKQKHEDVFVFKKMQRSQLTILVEANSTASSTDQLRGVTCNFILLDCEKDWEEIRNISDAPVHLITYEKQSVMKNGNVVDEDVFIVEDSTGGSRSLWQYRDKQSQHEKIYVTEDEFLLQAGKTGTGSRFCICDTPGMGKSWLLASLARKIQILHLDRIIIFIPLLKFVQNYKRKTEFQHDSSEILDHIFDHCTSTSMAMEILKTAITKQNAQLECFFDGLDEVPTEDLELTQKMIKSATGIGQNVNVYVTARPHLRKELEDATGAVAYDILPFSEENQVDYLVGFWKQKLPNSLESKLRQLATSCAQSLRKTLNKEERDIMGIPLQCHLLAQVYQEDARLYSDPVRTHNITRLEFTSVYEMYTKYIEMRFASNERPDCPENHNETDNLKMKRFHVFKALQLLFPEIAQEYAEREHVPDDGGSFAKQFSFGILEAHQSGGDTSTDFLHRTLAEFLVAEYFGDFLINLDEKPENEEYNERVLRVFSTKILMCSITSGQDSGDSQHSGSYYNRFSNSVIVHFLNEHLKRCHHHNIPKFLVTTFFAALEPFRLYQIFQSLLFHNCLHIFQFIKSLLRNADEATISTFKSFLLPTELPLNTSDMRIQPTYLLLRTAAAVSSLPLMKECFQLFKDCFDYDLDGICGQIPVDIETPLHMAVIRANYELVEFLLDKFSLEQCSILHYCSQYSYGETLKVVSLRIQICELLLNRSRMLLLEQLYFGNHIFTGPLVGWQIHLNLMKYLINQGADLRATRSWNSDQGNWNIVQCAGEYMTSKDLNEFCRFLIQDCNASYLLHTNLPDWGNPLEYILLKPSGDVLPIAQTFKKLSVSYSNELHEYVNRNLMFSAAHSGNIVKILAAAFNSGADYKYTTKQGDGIPHLLAAAGDKKNFKYVMSLGLSVNESYHGENTPLFYAMPYAPLYMMKFLVDNGASVYAMDGTRDTIAHKAAKWIETGNKFHDIVSFLIQHANCPNLFESVNKDEETALHIRLKCKMEVNLETVKLLVRSYKALVNILDESGNSLLLSAASHCNYMDIVKELHQHGSDICLQNKRCEGVLQLAAKTGNLELLEYYAQCGYKVYMYTWVELPPLLRIPNHPLLFADEHLAAIKYLVGKGADVNCTEMGKNIAHKAASKLSPNDFHDLVLFLLASEKTAPILKAKDANGKTPLQLMLGWSKYRNASNETVELLLGIPEADVNAVDNGGHNLFLTAVAGKQNVSVLQALVRHGVNLSGCNKYGQNAFHLAVRVESKLSVESLRIVSFLCSLDIDVHQTDKNGGTPIDEARKHLEFYKKEFELRPGKIHILMEILHLLERRNSEKMKVEDVLK